MAAKSNDRVIVTAQLMFLVERLRQINGYNVVREYADGRGGAIFELTHDISEQIDELYDDDEVVQKMLALLENNNKA